MHTFLISTVAFIVLIGLMVLVHEFGHFLVAKLCGVRVERFSIGFPPRLFGFKIGETDYCISATPLGGYVKMTGENMPGENMQMEGADQDLIEAQKEDPGALTSHPRWQRILIAVAGPVANFVLALVLMFVYYGWINEVPVVQVKSPTVDWVVPGTAAAQAGMQPGDVIERFAGIKDPSWNQVFLQIKINANEQVPVVVDRDNKTVDLSLQVPASAKSDNFDLSDAGILRRTQPGPIGVADVLSGSPAAGAGLRPGDAIESVDGLHLHSVESLVAFLQAGEGKPVSVVIERNGKALPPVTIKPKQIQGGWKLGFGGALPAMHQAPLPLAEAMAHSTKFLSNNTFFVIEVVKRMFEHKVSVRQLSGPVGIAHMAGEAAEAHGWYPKFFLAAVISLQLGILNLLPFPILDGGMILFLLIESVLRHDINLNVKERIYQAAFVVLVVFFAFIIFNDVSRLGIFGGKP